MNFYFLLTLDVNILIRSTRTFFFLWSCWLFPYIFLSDFTELADTFCDIFQSICRLHKLSWEGVLRIYHLSSPIVIFVFQRMPTGLSKIKTFSARQNLSCLFPPVYLGFPFYSLCRVASDITSRKIKSVWNSFTVSSRKCPHLVHKTKSLWIFAL